MAKIIGIDLGTTNSLVAYIDPQTGAPKCIPGPSGSALCPSVVSLDADSSVIVGEPAQRGPIAEGAVHLFADGPGEKNERNSGCLDARNGESGHPIEPGQTEIRQYEIGQAGAERASHLLLVRHALVGASESCRLQSPNRQLRVRRRVFDQ